MSNMEQKNIITAVILAAGQSSRLHPFSNSGKAMISLLGKPILEHTIESLKKAKVTNLIIVVPPGEMIEKYFGDGQKFGVHITYAALPKPEGMGKALLTAKEHIHDSNFFVLAPYHLQADSFIEELLEKKTEGVDAVLLAKAKKDISGRGVIKVTNDRVIDVVEKPNPEVAPSNLCIVGIYLLSASFLTTLSETPHEHYQFEKALSQFAQNHDMRYVETKTEPLTLKYPWDIFGLQEYLLSSITGSVDESATIAKSAEIIGEVVIGDNVILMEGAKIKGPCYIGNGVTIGNNAIVRGGSDIEAGCVIGANMEVKHSLIMNGATTHSGFIGDSIIGEKCKIAAQFCSANVRIDRKPVSVTVKEESVNTGLKSLGTFIGNNVKIGIKASTMPGVVIGNSSVIGASTNVLHNVLADTTYYTKFHEVVIKQ